MDEAFGPESFCSVIAFVKTSGLGTRLLDPTFDYLLWYAKNKQKVKYRQLFTERKLGEAGATQYTWAELPDGLRRPLTEEEVRSPDLLPRGARIFAHGDLTSQTASETTLFEFEFAGRRFRPSKGGWKTNSEGMRRLIEANRIFVVGDTPRYVRYFTDFPVFPNNNLWQDTSVSGFYDPKIYVVQTNSKVIARCLLMTTDPGDLVFDPTCGSGTTAYVAEQWGRRWVTCDTSRVALALARQRLMTATFPYYKLAHPVGEHLYGAPAGGPRGPSPTSGVSGGFIYKTVPHITLRSIAQNEPPEPETLYDQPEIDRAKVRVSGPFTVEAIPVPAMESVGEPSGLPAGGQGPPLPPEARADDIARRGRGEGRIANPAADHLTTMIELLRKAGVVFPGGKKLMLENLRPLGVGGLHAEAEAALTPGPSPEGRGESAGRGEGARRRVAVSFGPRHGPVTVMQTEEATRTARANAYDVLILAGFAIDAAAQDFIQKNPLKELAVHFANVNPDVLVGDLLKTSRASQVFTVFGSPDVVVRRSAGLQPGKGAGLKASATEGEWYIVELLGVDIYDPNTGELHQSRGEDVAAWFLDQDYDGYTFCISQAFFPANKDAWEKLERALKGTLDPEKFEALRGTVSLPFQPGQHRRIAVKVIDMRGNEVIRVLPISGPER